MGLETFTYISTLNPANPVGATDPKSQGDDHIRGVKLALVQSFGAVAGAVSSTDVELSLVHGVTGKTGSGKLVLDTSPTIGGTLTASTVAATTLTGAGSGITALNASNLASGTVPDARFPATLPAASGVNLTALNATNLASGTVADARLSANIPRLNAANTFSSGQVFSNAGTVVTYLYDTAAGTNEKLWALGTATATQFAVGSTYTDGGSGIANGVLMTRSGATITEIDLAATTLGFTGNLSTPNASASEVGFKGIPTRLSGAADVTLALTDCGGCVTVNSASCNTITLPNDSTVAWPIGTAIVIVIGGIADTVALAYGSGVTMTLMGPGGSPTTLQQNSMVTILKVSANNWVLSGVGAS
jgi:hypothetical protein